jgi:hypothetical protein
MCMMPKENDVMNTKFFLPILCTLMLSACGALMTEEERYITNGALRCMADVAPLGGNAYAATGGCSGGLNQLRAAEVFCKKMGKESIVKNYGRNIIFECHTPNTVGTPKFQKSPDIIIQDNRK